MDLKRIEKAFQDLPYDIAVLAADEFDLNFERQSFFGEKWMTRGLKLIVHTEPA